MIRVFPGEAGTGSPEGNASEQADRALQHSFKTLKRSRRYAAGLAAAVFFWHAPASAACSDGLWPLQREAAAFADPVTLPVVETGADLTVTPFRAFVLKMRPLADAGLPLPPGRPGAGDGTAGFVRLKIGEAGLYQVTAPEAVWLDVIVQGQAVSPEAFTPARDCPGVRKSVRFRLPAGNALLQVSRTQAVRLSLALTRIP